MDLIGIVKEVSPTEQKSKTFWVREFVLTVGEEYPQHITFQCHNAKCDLLLDVKANDKVKVWFTILGKEYTNANLEKKHFNTLSCWKIDKV
jgi:hypothetical protein